MDDTVSKSIMDSVSSALIYITNVDKININYFSADLNFALTIVNINSNIQFSLFLAFDYLNLSNSICDWTKEFVKIPKPNDTDQTKYL